jgi:hypothetical protein
MGGVDLERHLGVGLTPPTLNHQEKPPDTQSTSGVVGGGWGLATAPGYPTCDQQGSRRNAHTTKPKEV